MTKTIDNAIGEKDRAIQRVEDGASELWLALLRDAVNQTSKKLETFSTDDVWDRLDELKIKRLGEPRALGSVMRSMRAEGTLKLLKEYTPSRRRHMTPIRVWGRA